VSKAVQRVDGGRHCGGDDVRAVALLPMVDESAAEELDRITDTETGTPYLMLLETHIARSEQAIAFTRVHVNDRFVRFSITRRH
jgi:hypothetical protein